MRIHVDDHALVNELCTHFARSGFTAGSVGGGVIEIARPDATSDDQERREVLLHLRVWEIVNPGAAVTVVV
jgi:hypothetical protein